VRLRRLQFYPTAFRLADDLLLRRRSNLFSSAVSLHLSRLKGTAFLTQLPSDVS